MIKIHGNMAQVVSICTRLYYSFMRIVELTVTYAVAQKFTSRYNRNLISYFMQLNNTFEFFLPLDTVPCVAVHKNLK